MAKLDGFFLVDPLYPASLTNPITTFVGILSCNSRFSIGDGSSQCGGSVGSNGGGEGGDMGSFTRPQISSQSFDWKKTIVLFAVESVRPNSDQHGQWWNLPLVTKMKPINTPRFYMQLKNDIEMVTQLARVPNGDLVA